MFNNMWWISALTGSLLLLLGCQSTPQTERLGDTILNNVSTSKLIEDVPFYPQQEFYCGPTTLSEALNFYGHSTTPGDIAPSLFIPRREGSLQLEMISAARSYGLLPYATQSDFETLFSLIDDNVPVIVFQNVATSWFPMWHYALVIGYDQTEKKIIVHTGETQAHEMSYELFERVWQRGNYWILALLGSEQTYSYLDSFIYTKAAHDMLTVGLNLDPAVKPREIAAPTDAPDYGEKVLITNKVTTNFSPTPITPLVTTLSTSSTAESRLNGAAINYLTTATKVWPQEWLSYFLLGNHYLNQSDQAAKWFSKGYEYASENPEYLNNYGYALVQEGCIMAAKNLITAALKISPDDLNLLATKNEFDLIPTPSETSLQDHCASYVI